jgi:hypothetical protein
MTTLAPRLGAFLFLVGATATATAQPARPPGARGPLEAQPAAEPEPPECPDFVRGAKLSVRDVEGGVRFKVTAGRTGYVAPLRETLHELQRFVAQNQARSAVQVTSEGNPTRVYAIPPMAIAVKDVAGGALVTVRAEADTSVDELRIQARQIEKLWHASTCINGEDSLATPPPILD